MVITEQPAKRQRLSWQDACSKILSTDTDIAQIPAQLMAALLVEQHSELQAVKLQLKEAVAELDHIKTNSYKVQPLNDGVEHAKENDALYERADALWDVWTDTETSPARKSLIQVPLDTNTISSALALYRVRCLFLGATIQVVEDYNSVWEVCLKTDDNVVVLADLGGAVLVWCQQYNEDVRELLAVIVDPECPHPTASTVAGKVSIGQRNLHKTLPTSTATPI